MHYGNALWKHQFQSTYVFGKFNQFWWPTISESRVVKGGRGRGPTHKSCDCVFYSILRITYNFYVDSTVNGHRKLLNFLVEFSPKTFSEASHIFLRQVHNTQGLSCFKTTRVCNRLSIYGYRLTLFDMMTTL